MSISQIGRTIGESVTLKLNEKAAILRAKGDPVIHPGGGEPKSKPPMDARGGRLVELGRSPLHARGCIPALKQAIIRYTEEFYNRGGTRKRTAFGRGEAGDVRLAGDPESAGGGRLPGPVLGELPGDGFCVPEAYR